MNSKSKRDELKESNRLAREATEWLEKLSGKADVTTEFVAWLLASPAHVQSFLIVGQIYHIYMGVTGGADPDKLNEKKIEEIVTSSINAFPELFGTAMTSWPAKIVKPSSMNAATIKKKLS